MEKPLLNLRSGVNFLRYHYFFGDFYYLLLVSQICLIIGGIWGVLGGIISKGFLLTPLITFLLAIILFFLMAIGVLKVFFVLSTAITFKSCCAAALFGGFFVIGLLFLFSGGLQNALLGLILFIIILGVYLAFDCRVGRINIFPNRIEISVHGNSKLIIYYRDLTMVKWVDGPLEQILTPKLKTKQIKTLSLITLYSTGEDFVIHLFYVLFELETVCYVVQPATYQSAFAQNARNGWIEKWRWDGSKLPPPGWVKPDNIPI
jgi:hypothetical protein